MALCEGCQEFQHHVFQPIDELLQDGVTIRLHGTFAEMSECAETCCDLCKFFRREVCLTPDSTTTDYLFCDDHFGKDHSGQISVSLRKCHDVQEWTCNYMDFKSSNWRFLSDRNHKDARTSNMTACFDRGYVHAYRPRVTGLEQLVDMSLQWLDTCRSEHEGCRTQPTQHPQFLPTRLIDAGLPGQPMIKLVLGESLKMTGTTIYLTLSYCWGMGNDAACTTKFNIEERFRGLLVSSLPKTIQDAIVLTRAFGVRYLWVDALCILQREIYNQDWQRELPNMGKIYRSSLFTIAASSTSDSSKGFLRRRTCAQWPVQTYQLSPKGGRDNNINLLPTVPQWIETIEISVLSKRGWVLQERMLASRVLYWTEVGVFWECNGVRRSEYSKDYGRYRGSPRFFQLPELINSIKASESSSVDRAEEQRTPGQNDMWTQLLEFYSQKALTRVTDKLPAITGLGQELGRLAGREFELGVFKHDLLRELAWVSGLQITGYGGIVLNAEQQAVRVAGTPSWCWASAHRHLMFRPTYGTFQELAMSVRLSGQKIQVCGRLGNIRVTALGGNSVTLTRSSDRFVLHTSPYTFKPLRPLGDGAIKSAEGHVIGEIAVFDTLSEALPELGGTITCVEWLSWTGGYKFEPIELQQTTVTGALIIAPTQKGSNTYRRIGWLEVFDTTFFDEEPQDIIII